MRVVRDTRNLYLEFLGYVSGFKRLIQKKCSKAGQCYLWINHCLINTQSNV